MLFAHTSPCCSSREADLRLEHLNAVNPHLDELEQVRVRPVLGDSCFPLPSVGRTALPNQVLTPGSPLCGLYVA